MQEKVPTPIDSPAAHGVAHETVTTRHDEGAPWRHVERIRERLRRNSPSNDSRPTIEIAIEIPNSRLHPKSARERRRRRRQSSVGGGGAARSGRRLVARELRRSELRIVAFADSARRRRRFFDSRCSSAFLYRLSLDFERLPFQWSPSRHSCEV